MDEVTQTTALSINKLKPTEKQRVPSIKVNEIYLDGKLKKAELIDEDEKSYGIFMHSLILSNYAEVMTLSKNQVNVIGDDFEKAIFQYTASKGFNKNLMESIAPRVSGLPFDHEEDMRISAHVINEKMRIISKGTPEELLSRCSYILLDSKFVKITRRIFREVNGVLISMMERCMGVYAIAIKDLSKISVNLNRENYVSDMTLVALVGVGVHP